ncbi:MAG: RNA-binding S4 domain-containing protein [Candidatus Poribacteria bacterium]|nr:RNA-binding S4 domain-containing protein [Candidatus Poribacteria bacterium]
MRLDKFLQVSRIIKRRSVANSICNRGRVLVNGQSAKAGKELAVGDTLSITFRGEGESVYEVLEVPSGNVPKGKASTLYRIISSPARDV